MTFEQANESRSYLSHLREYIPTGQQMQELGARVANLAGAKHVSSLDSKPVTPRVVLWKEFQEFEFGHERYVFLVLGLIDGFQIFEVQSSRVCRLVAQHSDAPVSSAFGAQLHSSSFSQQASAAFDAHLLNQRALASTPIGQVRCITHPSTLRRGSDDAPPAPANAAAPFYGTLLAVCSAEDRPNFPRSVLKIFSLAHGSYVHLIRFPRKILSVSTHPSSSFLTIMLEHELLVYSIPTDTRTLEFKCLWSTRIFPNPGPHILAQLSQGNLGGGAAAAGGGGGGGGMVGAGGISSSGSGSDRLVNLGPNAAAILNTASFSRDEAAVIAMSKRWVAYCPNEPITPQQAQQQQAPQAGGFSSASPLMAHYAAVDPSQQEFHRSPLFQPLQDRQSAGGSGVGTISSSSSFSLGSSLSSVGAMTGSSGESLSTVASGLASKLYNMAGQGKKLAANYLSGEDATGQNVSLLGGGTGSGGGAGHGMAHLNGSGVLGTVVVRDMLSERVIATIRAHPGSQITHLAFDRSGTLLATAPEDGQYVHVYAVVVVPQPCSMAGSLPSGGASVDMSPQMQSQRRPSAVHATNSPLLGGLSPAM